MALHHKLCHTLGGAFGLPHAETHAVILPHAVRYNAEAAPHAMRRIGAALGVADPAIGLVELALRVGAPTALSKLGMPQDGIAHAATLATTDPYWNPRPIERDAIARLIARAWSGELP